MFFTTVLSIFAATIAVGVVYNNARIQLAERAWELASLRVLGFTRREVSVLLLGELAVEIALAIPLGFARRILARGAARRADAAGSDGVSARHLPEHLRLRRRGGGGGGVVSALIVRNRIDNLDLVAVLKTRE